MVRSPQNPKYSRMITIFEGPDGGGKTTLAKSYAEQTNARYVHFHHLPDINASLDRLYAEAMLPAVMGYQDVVMDRAWHSERPYANICQRPDRLNTASRRMLERLALRCGAVVVYCMPSVSTVIDNYRNRGNKEELLAKEQAIIDVYAAYQAETT